MANLIKMQIQLRRDTTANWILNKDVIPAAGEPCFDLDLGTLKIGNGVDTYEKLQSIGSVKVDGKSIILDGDVLALAGFDAADIGAQPRKTSDGGIEWVVPSTETVDGLQSAVAGLQSNVSGLQASVATIQEIVNPSTEGSVPLLDRVVTLEDQMNGTGEGSVDAKIDAKINEFASRITDDGVVNTIQELVTYVAEHGTEVADMAADILALQGLVGETSVMGQIMNAVNASEAKAGKLFERVKYEVSSKPVGTLVDYRDKEIRIMVPADTKFELQNSGANADKNAYYIGFKAYAPEGAVSFKEDLAEIISDNTMYTFEGNDFAGVDAYGRKYSICWLAVARYDEATQTWTRYGAQSSVDKYIGWYYSVEWYDANGNKIGSDCIRINLSNESCHNDVKPFYMTGYVNKIEGITVGGTLLDVVDKQVNIPVGAGLKASDEIVINEDGSLCVGAISFDKIMQGMSEIVLDGGSAE